MTNNISQMTVISVIKTIGRSNRGTVKLLEAKVPVQKMSRILKKGKSAERRAKVKKCGCPLGLIVGSIGCRVLDGQPSVPIA